MATNIQSRCVVRQPDCVIERIPIRHQRCRSQHPFAMRVHNAGVDVTRKAEIIGIDDQPLQINFNLKNVQTNGKEFFRISAEILQQTVQFPSGPRGLVIQGLIH